MILKKVFTKHYLIPANINLNIFFSKESNIKIPFGKENIFCFDNEAIRFLAAVEKKISFSTEDRNDFSVSWERSAEN